MVKTQPFFGFIKFISSLILLVYFLPVESQTVPIVIDNNGFIFIDVTINDSVKSKFLLDTGGGLAVISKKLSQKLGSMKDAGYFTGFRNDGDRIDAELFYLSSISFGNFKVTNVKSAIYPPLDDYGMDGVISMKEFENTPFTIDFKNSTLTIEDRESMKKIEENAEPIPIELDIQRDVSLDIFVPLTLNNKIKIMAEFDTGSGYDLLLVNSYFMQKLEIDSSSAPKESYNTSSGSTITDYKATINNFKYYNSQKLSSDNKSARFRRGLIYEGLIGSAMFKDKILTIDIPDKKMFVRE